MDGAAPSEPVPDRPGAALEVPASTGDGLAGGAAAEPHGAAAPLAPPPGATPAPGAAPHRPAPPRLLRRRVDLPRLLSVDAVAVLASLALGMGVLRLAGQTLHLPWVGLLVALPAFLVPFALSGLYRSSVLHTDPSGVPVFIGAAHALPLVALLTVATLLVTGWTRPGAVLAATAALVLPVVVTVPAFRSAGGAIRRRIGVPPSRRVLIVGSGELADSLQARLERDSDVRVVGMVDDDPPPGYAVLDGLANLRTVCRANEVDSVIVALPHAASLDVSESLHDLMGSLDVALVPSFFELMSWRSGLEDVAGIPVIPLRSGQGVLARVFKRTFDIVVSSILLILAAPLFAAAAVAIKCTDGGPVFFVQRRTGKGLVPFRILKFRTMTVGAEAERDALFDLRDADGPRFKLARDPRVTRVGSIMRRYSIDELPQLLNVLGGRMSLVGPRPFPLDEAAALTVGAAAARFDVLPGMTGLWQVSGRSDLSWDDLCRLDAIYVRSWSLGWDLRILLKTPWATLRRQGAY